MRCNMFVFLFKLLVLMAIWGVDLHLQGLSSKVKLKFRPGKMGPSTSSSFIFPNSLISCYYCYFAHVTLLSQRVKLISHFLLLPTSSPSPSLSTVCAQLCIFHLIFSLSLTFVFSFLLLYFLLFTSSPCPSIHQLSALPSTDLTDTTFVFSP